jgi:hypothetical protein
VYNIHYTIIYEPIIIAAKGIREAQVCQILKESLFFLFTVPCKGVEG